jgi:hypothetical protein
VSGLTEIKIIDLDVSLTRQSDKAEGLRHMFLKLSETPPSGWVEIFNGERSFPRHSMWRKAWIEDQCIVVDCVPEELERYHLIDLKEDVANANAKYRDYVSRVKRQEEQQSQAEEAEKRRLDELRDKLDFS